MNRTVVIPLLLTVSMATVPHKVSGSYGGNSTQVRVSVLNRNTGPPLEVVRISPTAGYIQTPGWGNLSLQSMHSLVRVEVPEGHIAMISMLYRHLDDGNHACNENSPVMLVVYDTSMTNTFLQCKRFRPAMRKYLSKGENLYVHFKCGETEKTGFRMFFSVVEDSALLLRKTAEVDFKQWNCSVPNFVDFKPHFPCDLIPQCVNKEDEQDCPYFSEECGLGFVTMGSRCLIFRKNVKQTKTWREMQQVCEKRGGSLVSVGTVEDFHRLLRVMDPVIDETRIVKGHVIVGLHSASKVLPMMYRNEVQLLDGTIVFSRATVIRSSMSTSCGQFILAEKWRYCRRVRNKCIPLYIEMTLCTREQPLNTLCEFPKKSASKHTHSPVQIQLVLPSSSNNSNLPLPGCPLEHVTRDFLACDDLSTCWSRDTSSCTTGLTPPPSFTCADEIESVPYTLVCDVRPDCGDGSDERFCEFPPCDLPTPFYCSDNECVPWTTVCDGQRDCYNGVDEDLCSKEWGKTLFKSHPPPAIVQLSYLGRFTIQPMSQSQLADLSPAVCPETHFHCPDNGYCMPVFLRCNGVYDCLGHEDEAGCNSYTCPGFYRCRGSQICLHPQHVCDGIFQCPRHDDELVCDLSCPVNCTCYGLAFYCRQPFQARNFTKLRFLDGRGSGMKVSELTVNVMLIYLSLAANGLTTVGELKFYNLRTLDLSENHLTKIHLDDLTHLPHLETLSLSANPLLCLFQCEMKPERTTSIIQRSTNQTSSSSMTLYSNSSQTDNVTSLDSSERNLAILSLRTLGLFRVRVKVLDTAFLSLLPNLHTVNMSGGGVDTLLGEGFQALTQLRVLDLRRCPLTNFPRDIFRGLQELETVYSDNYKLCCSATLPVGFISKNCHAPSDELSSCEALLRSDTYRVFLSVFAILALLGNASSFVFRVLIQKRKTLLSFDVFVAHLCVGDFWMGVYLSIIGVADRLYQGTYLWEDNTWKASTVCHMAGFLSLVSSEVSALVICLITIDRFLVIRFPFSTFHFGARSAHVASLCVWGLGCLIAAVPLLPGVAHWQYYSQTGICIPLPVSRADTPGYAYAFGVMIVANFVFFIVIAAGQLVIYWSVQTNLVSSTETTKKTQDLTIARRLMTVAMSDFLCWFPIGLAGILTATGTPVSSEVNVALAIFVLPFNSALNPFLYTLNIVLEKRRKVENEQIQERLMAQLRCMATEEKLCPTKTSSKLS